MPFPAARIFAFSLVLAGCGPSAASGTAAGPSSKPVSALIYDPIGRDLGTVTWPDGTDTFFKFKNSGKKTVKIIDFFANCGCTNPKLRIVNDKNETVREGHGRGETMGPLLVIAPGESGELAVRFESRGLGGESKDHVSMITVVTDEPDVTPTGLFIKVAIERKWELTPAQVAFDPMGAKQTQTQEAKIFILTPGATAPFDAKIVSAPPFIRAELKEAMLGLRPYLQVQLSAGPNLKQQVLQGEVIVEGKFSKPKNEELVKVTIPVFVPVIGDIQMKPGIFDFQVVDAGKAAKAVPVTLQFLDPDRKLQLGEVKMEGDHADLLKLKIDPDPKGNGYILILISENGFPALAAKGAHGLVRISTSLADFPEIRLPYRALPRPVH